MGESWRHFIPIIKWFVLNGIAIDAQLANPRYVQYKARFGESAH
jgi:hypothetical protein